MIQTYNASKVANELAEPIIPSLFKIRITPPDSLLALPVDILSEEIKSISGFDAFEKVPDLIYQTFGPGTRRQFPGVTVDNVVELSVTCNVNLRGDSGTHATNLLTLKKIKDLAYNRATGKRGTKAEACFTVTVSRFNKDWQVWNVYTMENCLFGASGITGLDECNIESDEAVTLSFTLISDKNKSELADDI